MVSLSPSSHFKQRSYRTQRPSGKQSRPLIKNVAKSDAYELSESSPYSQELQEEKSRRRSLRRSISPRSAYREKNKRNERISSSKSPSKSRQQTIEEYCVENDLSNELKDINLSPIRTKRASKVAVNDVIADDVTLESWGREMKKFNSKKTREFQTNMSSQIRHQKNRTHQKRTTVAKREKQSSPSKTSQKPTVTKTPKINNLTSRILEYERKKLKATSEKDGKESHQQHDEEIKRPQSKPLHQSLRRSPSPPSMRNLNQTGNQYEKRQQQHQRRRQMQRVESHKNHISRSAYSQPNPTPIDDNTLTTEEETSSGTAPFSTTVPRSQSHQRCRYDPNTNERLRIIPNRISEFKEKKYKPQMRSKSIPKSFRQSSPNLYSYPFIKPSNSSESYFPDPKRNKTRNIVTEDNEENSVRNIIDTFESLSPRYSDTNNLAQNKESLVHRRKKSFDKNHKKSSRNQSDLSSQASNGSSHVSEFVRQLEEKSRKLARRQAQIERKIRRQLSLSPSRTRKDQSSMNYKSKALLQPRSKSTSSLMKSSNLNNVPSVKHIKTFASRTTEYTSPKASIKSPKQSRPSPRSRSRSSKKSQSKSVSRSPTRSQRKVNFAEKDFIRHIPPTSVNNSKPNQRIHKIIRKEDKTTLREIDTNEYIPVTLQSSTLGKNKSLERNIRTSPRISPTSSFTENQDVMSLRRKKSEESTGTDTSNSVKFRAKFFNAAFKLKSDSFSSHGASVKISNSIKFNDKFEAFKPADQIKDVAILEKEIINKVSFSSSEVSRDLEQKPVFLPPLNRDVSKSPESSMEYKNHFEDSLSKSSSMDSSNFPARVVITKMKNSSLPLNATPSKMKQKDLVSFGQKGTVRRTIELMHQRKQKMLQKRNLQQSHQRFEEEEVDDDATSLSSITNPVYGEKSSRHRVEGSDANILTEEKIINLLLEAEKDQNSKLRSIMKNLKPGGNIQDSESRFKAVQEMIHLTSNPQKSTPNDDNISNKQMSFFEKEPFQYNERDRLQHFSSSPSSKEIIANLEAAQKEFFPSIKNKDKVHLANSTQPFTSAGGIVAKTTKIRSLKNDKEQENTDGICETNVTDRMDTMHTQVDNFDATKASTIFKNQTSTNPFEDAYDVDENENEFKSSHPFDADFSDHFQVDCIKNKSTNPFDDVDIFDPEFENKKSTNPFDDFDLVGTGNKPFISSEVTAKNNKNAANGLAVSEVHEEEKEDSLGNDESESIIPFDEAHESKTKSSIAAHHSSKVGSKKSSNPFDVEGNDIFISASSRTNPFDSNFDSNVKINETSRRSSKLAEFEKQQKKGTVVLHEKSMNKSNDNPKKALKELEEEKDKSKLGLFFTEVEDSSVKIEAGDPLTEAMNIYAKQQDTLSNSGNSGIAIQKFIYPQDKEEKPRSYPSISYSHSGASTVTSYDTDKCCEEHECANLLEYGIRNVVDTFGFALSPSSRDEQQVSAEKKMKLRKLALKSRQKILMEKNIFANFGKFLYIFWTCSYQSNYNSLIKMFHLHLDKRKMVNKLPPTSSRSNVSAMKQQYHISPLNQPVDMKNPLKTGREKPWQQQSLVKSRTTSENRQSIERRKLNNEKKKRVDDMLISSASDEKSKQGSKGNKISDKIPLKHDFSSKFANLSPKKLRLRNQRLRNFFSRDSKKSNTSGKYDLSPLVGRGKQNASILRDSNTNNRDLERKSVRWRVGSDLEDVTIFDDSGRSGSYSPAPPPPMFSSS